MKWIKDMLPTWTWIRDTVLSLICHKLMPTQRWRPTPSSSTYSFIFLSLFISFLYPYFNFFPFFTYWFFSTSSSILLSGFHISDSLSLSLLPFWFIWLWSTNQCYPRQSNVCVFIEKWKCECVESSPSSLTFLLLLFHSLSVSSFTH